jgi:HK97 family phage portal protein
MFDFGQPKSGKRVDATNAMEIEAVLSCIRVLAESIAATPFELFRRDAAEENVTKAEDEELFWIMSEQPNDEMTSFEVRMWMMIDCLLRGNGYAQVIRSGKGVLEIWPLLASKVKPKRKENGELVYVYPMPDGKEAVLAKDEVLHIKGFIYGGLVGLSFIELQKDLLGSAKAAEDYSAEFFGNATSPSGIIEVPEELSDEAYERLKRDWAATYTGEGNRHKSPILEGGASFTPSVLNHEESQLLETQKYKRTAIAGLLRVPAHMINDLEKATFSNIEHQDLGFAKHTLRPWFTNWEQRCKLTLIQKEHRRSFFFRHDDTDLLRGDLKSRAEAMSKFVQNGIYSPNDARRKLKENPYEGGNTYLINGTLRPVDQAGLPATTPETTISPEDANLLE